MYHVSGTSGTRSDATREGQGFKTWPIKKRIKTLSLLSFKNILNYRNPVVFGVFDFRRDRKVEQDLLVLLLLVRAAERRNRGRRGHVHFLIL